MEVVQSELGDFQGSIHITLSPGPKNLLASAIITTTDKTQEVKMEGPTGQPVPREAPPVGQGQKKLLKVNGMATPGATGTDMMAPSMGGGDGLQVSGTEAQEGSPPGSGGVEMIGVGLGDEIKKKKQDLGCEKLCCKLKKGSDGNRTIDVESCVCLGTVSCTKYGFPTI